jgi:hypothetical protein
MVSKSQGGKGPSEMLGVRTLEPLETCPSFGRSDPIFALKKREGLKLLPSRDGYYTDL